MPANSVDNSMPAKLFAASNSNISCPYTQPFRIVGLNDQRKTALDIILNKTNKNLANVLISKKGRNGICATV